MGLGLAVNRAMWFPERRRDELRQLARRSQQVVILAAAVGAMTGLFVAGFDRLVVNLIMNNVLTLSPWVIAVVPGVGLLVALWCRKVISPGTDSRTADEYLRAFHDQNYRLTWRPFAARTVASVATLSSGVPMGLEGPSIYAGATIGSQLQRRFPRVFRGADHRLLLVAGAAAGVAAIFKAPATGAVFALEVPYQDDLARRMLLPALVSSACGYLVFVAVNGTNPLFPVDGTSSFSVRDLIGAIAVGVIAGIGARGFALMIRVGKQFAGLSRPLLATLGAGLVIAGLFAVGRLLTGESLIVSPGYNVVAWAAAPGRSIPMLLAILALRCIATATGVAGGGVGGLFIPLVIAGALIGSTIGHVVNHHDVTLFILIGVAAFLGAGYRVPLAAVMFVAETSGRPSFVVPGLLAAVAAELVMGSASVTSLQQATTFERPSDSGV